MGKASAEASKAAHRAIYDYVNVSIRKDSEYNKSFLVDHWQDFNYHSLNDFIVQAINNQIKSDLNNK